MHRSALPIALLLVLTACGTADRESRDPTIPSTTPTGAPQGFPLSGRVHAGPVCPVAQNPPDPACDDRPVANAVLLIEDTAGIEIGRTTTGADGGFSIVLPAGVYTFVPQPVEGLMGTAPPFDVTVVDGPVTGLDVAYDTGIR